MAKKKQLPTVTVATDKQKALSQALAQIEKQHGKNARKLFHGKSPCLKIRDDKSCRESC